MILRSYQEQTEVVRLLLSDIRIDPLANARIDPSALDNYAIIFLSYQGHAEVVRPLTC